MSDHSGPSDSATPRPGQSFRLFAGLIACIVIVGVLALTVLVARGRHARYGAALPDLQLAPFAVSDEQGVSRTLHPTEGVIAFVSSTCIHCQAALRTLGNAAAAGGTSRLTVVALDSLRPLRALIDSLRLPAALWRVPIGDGRFPAGARVRAVPTFYWVGTGGRVLDAQTGELTAVEAEKWISRAR